jgi:hypothetical protein
MCQPGSTPTEPRSTHDIHTCIDLFHGGGAERRAKFELSASQNVDFMSAGSYGSALVSVGISHGNSKVSACVPTG